MGRFEYAAAREVFVALANAYPDWTDVDVNLAIATLNRQQPGDEQRALTMLQAIIARHPKQLRAHFVAGLLKLYLGMSQDAVTHFRTVVTADPTDAYAAYYLGQCLTQVGAPGEAAAWFRTALDLDPYLRSAAYGAFQALARAGDADGAQAMLERYQQLEPDPRARLAEFKYKHMGSKADALAVDSGAAAPRALPPRPQGPLFEAGRPSLPELHGRSVTAADVNGDGHLDLFIAGNSSTLLLADGAGHYVPDITSPLSGIGAVNAALWGDIDNDGLLDVYLCRNGPNEHWRQTAPGQWQNVSATGGVAGGHLDSVDGALFDSDHDGDLDVFVVNRDDSNELFINNHDGSFRVVADVAGIASERGGRQVLTLDLDRDRDADLIVINDDGAHAAYHNELLWHYVPAPGFAVAPIAAAVAGDVDVNGRAEIYTVAPAGHLQRWEERARAWTAVPLGQVAPSAVAKLALQDVTGDGRLNLLVSDGVGWSAWALGRAGGERIFTSDAAGPLHDWVLVSSAGADGPSLVGLRREGGLVHWRAGNGRYPFIALSVSGSDDTSNRMRSNASGIGTRLTLRRGERWSVVDTFRSTSGPGQSLQAVNIGIGTDEQVDYVEIDWSDGVFQSELAIKPGTTVHLIETQRQLSSCPVIFAWNGARFEFVSDVLAAGSMGFALGPGIYHQPRRRENLLLPSWADTPRDGRYPIKVSEPMEEITYLDQAVLSVYDLPPGWQLALDERWASAGPEPTGEPFFFQQERLPRRAVNDRNEDVTDSILNVDARAAPVGERDRRFAGLLEKPHRLTLEFNQALTDGFRAPGAADRRVD